MSTRKLLLLSAGFAALSAFADTVTWDGGPNGLGWMWSDSDASCWDSDVNPGPDDTALFVDIPRFQSVFESGKLLGIAVPATDGGQSVQVVRFSNHYGINVNGNSKLSLNKVVADDFEPDGQIAIVTNGIQNIIARGEELEFDVGANHVLLNGGTFSGTAETPATFIKTGPGELVWSGAILPSNIASNWIKEGVVYKSGSTYPGLTGPVRVGGDGHEATLILGPNAHNALNDTRYPIEVLAGGTIRWEGNRSAAVIYQEVLTVDHGTYDAGGGGFYLYNNGNTERGPWYSFCGAVMTNASVTVGDAWEIKPADVPTAFYGKLILQAKFDKPISNGVARVDFLVSGDLNANQRGILKSGAGTMMVDAGDAVSIWGGWNGQAVEVAEGEFYFNSTGNGIGLGTNNVKVAAGAVFGGSGNIVGVTNFYNYIWRGYQGNVTLTGTEEAPAVFAPGHPDFVTGEFIPGTFTVGDVDICTNNVTFASYGELRIAVSTSGVSKLVVNGLLTLSGNDTLAIVGPEDISGLPCGDYPIVVWSEIASPDESIDGFASVTYNGKPISESGLKVFGQDNEIVLRVPQHGFVLIVR